MIPEFPGRYQGRGAFGGGCFAVSRGWPRVPLIASVVLVRHALEKDAWLSVPYVMAAQALPGITKALNKSSATASVKALGGW